MQESIGDNMRTNSRVTKLKTRYVILAIAIAAFLAMSAMPTPVKASNTYGPRVDELLCKIYAGSVAEFAAFDAAEIDLTDWPLTKDLITKYTGNATVTLDPYKAIGMYEFDINNNLTMLSYPNWRSPTSYPEFRHAIAHLVDKPYIITTYVGGYGAQLESPIMPWLRWFDPTMNTHPYNKEEAKQILFDAGWKTDLTDGSPAVFPPGHTLEGQTLVSRLTNGPHTGTDPGLIFYRRSDNTDRNLAGLLLITELETIGVPCDDSSVPSSVSGPKVTYEKNFHIYTGGWSLSRDPDYLYDLYHSNNINWNIEEFASNYDNIQNAQWDAALEGIKYALTLEEVEEHSHEACQVFGENVFFIPLWTTLGYMAHRKSWHVLNVDSYGVRNWWNLESINNPDIGVTGGQLKWGFAADVQLLNVIFSSSAKDWQVLDQIFDTLIKPNPLNIAFDMPWMASSWTVGTWTNPDTGQIASKISFTLKTGMKWINPGDGTIVGDVTPEDVKFSFQYVHDHEGWNYPLVADLYHNPDGSLKIEISANTITFYESIASVFAFHWVGELPIIPKFIYEDIADPHGFYPGGADNTIAMTGSGNFYFVSHSVGNNALLRANRNYFKQIVPNIDTDPTNIKTDWGIFKSNVRPGDWWVNVLDLIYVCFALYWEGPPGSIPQDINKDGHVNVLDVIIVATNVDADWS